MDTENFLLKRRSLIERLESRRAQDLSAYQGGSLFGLKLPMVARLALSMVPRGGIVTSLLQIGLPLAATFFLKKKPSFISGILARFLPSRA